MRSYYHCCDSYLTTVMEITEMTLKRHGVPVADELPTAGPHHPECEWVVPASVQEQPLHG